MKDLPYGKYVVGDVYCNYNAAVSVDYVDPSFNGWLQDLLTPIKPIIQSPFHFCLLTWPIFWPPLAF